MFPDCEKNYNKIKMSLYELNIYIVSSLSSNSTYST
jgi:hypothetical protein